MITSNIATSGGAEPHGVQTFTEDGIFIVPDKVTKIWITACAGGQSGSINNTSGSHSYSVNGGDGGDWIYRRPYQVIPGAEHAITIGKGGSGEIYNADKISQIAGGNTVISDLVTLVGGGISGNVSGGRAFRVTDSINMDDSTPILQIATLLTMCGLTAQNGLLPGGRHYVGKLNSYDVSIISGGGGSLGYGCDGTYLGDPVNARTHAGYGGGGGGLYTGSSSTSVMSGGDGIVTIEW